MKRVLAIVGAGEAAIPIINKSKEMGITTVAFGEGDSVAKNLVDLFIEKSIFDIDGMEEESRKYRINAVIASSEVTTESAALLAKRLGLPGNRCDKGFFARNKYLMREAIKLAKNVKQPNYFLFSGQKVEHFPVMVKAVDSCGKRGISLARSKEEFLIAVNNAKEMSSNHTVLIEEYISGGQEFSVECLADGEKKYVIQITEKITSGAPHFTEISHHQPAQLNCTYKEMVVDAANEILTLLGIDCGMAHLEIKIVNDEVYFIEVGARAGGDHIGDTLIGLSTDYDYYRGAIECSFGYLTIPEVHNIAYSGIIFHCWENRNLKEIFEASRNADWCIANTVKDSNFKKADSNIETVESGYIIYRMDHKLSLADVKMSNYEAEIINKRKDVFELVWNHNKEIGRTLTDEELRIGIQKFIDFGNIISVIENKKIIAFLMLYCNNTETLEAYICNVYVLATYRGLGLSKVILEKAMETCISNKFKTIKLHVAEDNMVAINLYKQYGFEPNGNIKNDGEKQIEMIKQL
ncbi:GNAT family N-acetyltransferase [Merdimonas faecis]|uniref:GNAT family N-acetyltransferase n=1 Tax=Merdimonas faecis TaxID=1653435 RepID=UPI0008637B06|nr:GNAT family N-acetyltransferase [Merdimonas faecis]